MMVANSRRSMPTLTAGLITHSLPRFTCAIKQPLCSNKNYKSTNKFAVFSVKMQGKKERGWISAGWRFQIGVQRRAGYAQISMKPLS